MRSLVSVSGSSRSARSCRRRATAIRFRGSCAIPGRSRSPTRWACRAAAAIIAWRDFAPAGRTQTPLFANIGGFTAAEIADSFFAVEPYVDAIEISLMCPNVQPGESFDELGLLREVLARIEARRKPAIVRVPNDTAVAPDRLAELIERCIAAGVAGLKVAGGRPVPEPRLGVKQGTLHGRAIFARAIANVERAAKIARGRIPIKGNGGVSTGADALAMLRAGAICIDLYSAFIYRGWNVARDINRELIAALAGAAPSSLGALA